MFEWLVLAGIFALVSGVAFAALNRASASNGGQGAAAKPDLVLGPLTPALAMQVPLRGDAKSAVQQDLRAAGFYRPSALVEYAAVRAVLVVFPLAAAGLLALLVENPRHALYIAGGGMVAALLGFSLPRLYLHFRARLRNREIERGLPVVLDLMSLCLTAGQTILAALGRMSLELRSAHPVWAEELEITRQQAELSSVEHALHQLADRVQLPEVRNVALILAQSERLGVDASDALLELSSSFRVTLKQRAEAQANRTSFWILFPTIFCLWIAAAILLIGPAYLEFWHARAGTDRMNGVRQSVDRVNRPDTDRVNRDSERTPTRAADRQSVNPTSP